MACGIAGFSQVPVKSFAESLAASQTASDTKGDAVTSSSGDLNLSVPIVTVKSRTMSFPVALNYTSGITVNQQSGPVGLGWEMPFGSIKRDYGAFEPDYTANNSEINMKNNNGVYDGRILPDINPFYYNKDLTYELNSDMGESGNSIADEYHVNVPGFFSNTFFNSSDNELNPFQWTFQEYVPYKVDNSIRNFEVAQEFSRINEANLGDLNFSDRSLKTEFDRGYSYAAAIGLLPFVHNGHVEVPSAGGDYNPTGDDKVVRYDDFESFTITDDNGVQFIFGRPLRGQKYIISEDPYWSTVNKNGDNHEVGTEGNFWKTDFIAEWLLTEIRTPDFVDVNNNGKADDEDLGDWIRIEYTQPEKIEQYFLLASSLSGSAEKVPSYREWSNFSQSDRASSLMFEKAYVTKIITPTQEIDFTISKRYEVDHDYYSKPANKVAHEWFYEDRQFLTAGGTAEDFDILYPVETMKYDTIRIKNKSKDHSVYSTENHVLGAVVLNYAEKGSAEELAVSNYLIRNANNEDRLIDRPSEGNTIDIGDYYTNEGRGKTTLLGLTFYSDKVKEDDTQVYQFEYANNPSYSEIHKREIVRKRLYPSIRQSNWQDNTLFDPVAINEINYYEEGGTLAAVHPSEFLIDCPYEEVYEKLSLPTNTQRMYYLHNEILPAGAAVVESTIPHVLHPVKDVMNYAINPDGTQNKAAWSLTKITYPTQASIGFEYEADDFVLSEDEVLWTIESDEIPLIKEYNELARRRSRTQDVANQINTGKYDKTLTAAFSMELKSSSGGVRLKKKIINDGIHDPIEIQYNYGDGHFTALPAAFVQNAYSSFNSFVSRERKRHDWEKLFYHSAYPSYLAGWKNDYDEKMNQFAFTSVAVDKVKSTHFYEYIEEVYENGASRKKTFGNLKLTNGVFYDVHKVIKARDDLGSGKPKFIYTSDVNSYGGIDLLRTEEFENGSVTAYETKTLEYGVEKVNEFRLMSNRFPLSDEYDNSFETWLCLGDNPATNPDPYYYHNSVFTGTYNGYKVAEGDITIIDLSSNFYTDYTWVNAQGSAFGPSFVNMKNTADPLQEINVSYGFHYNAETVQRWGSRKKILLEEKTNSRGKENITNYEYEPLYYYPTKVTKTALGSNTIIKEDEYAFQTYDGLTTLFESSNVLKSIARSTIYYNAIDNANVLSAFFTEWEFSGSYPRPGKQYHFKTKAIDHASGKFTLVPYTISGTNPDEWHQIEKEPLEYNSDGLRSLQRGNQIYEKNVVGYKRSQIKAEIASTVGKFDATYTGFEDLSRLTNVAIGSLPYPEYWYYQDIYETPLSVPAFVNTEPSGLNECANEVSTIVGGTTMYISIALSSNEDAEGQIFHVGDNVTLTGTYTGGTFTPLSTTIVDIVALDGTEVKFCFADALSSEYVDHWADAPVVSLSKQKATIDTEVSTAYKRTGRYSYKLNSKKAGGETARRTPVRPVIPPNSGLDSFPAICHTAPGGGGGEGITGGGYYPNECFIYYEASAWVRHDFDIPRLAADDAGELPFKPYGTGGTGVFVTYGKTETSDDRNTSYVRGTVSETLTIGEKDVKLVYKLWSSDRTVLIDEGVYYLNDLTNKWKQYKIEIPLFRGAVGQQLDVYVESNLVDFNAINNSKSVFVDDLIIYPKDAVYNYLSFDKFTQPTHSTDNNDVFESRQSDDWGRTKRIWNGYGDEISAFDYAIGNGITVDNSVTETTWTAKNKYFKTRTYTNGFGEAKQTIVSDPLTNKRVVLSTIDFNEMGWAEKNYKSYGLNGSYLSNKYHQTYPTKVQDLYASNHAFNKEEYVESLEKFPRKTIEARENTESEIATFSNRYRNLSSVGGVYGIPVYAAGELAVVEITSGEGSKARSYTDDLGRLVLSEVEVGFEYADNPDGTITHSGTEKPYQQTWYKYDVLGRLIKTVDPDGKVSEYTYNSIGQQIETTTADRGTTKMKYDTYGQLRFSQSEKDLEVIASPGIIDQFKYVKYDRWGRIVNSGVMRELSANPITNGLGEEYTPADLFNSPSHLEDQSFPLEGIMFNQIDREYLYDGSRVDYNAHAVLEKIVNSNHVLNANYQFDPTEIDKESFAYLLDGNIKSKAYLYNEFSAPHLFTYQYSRFGVPLKKKYQHPTDLSQDYTWEYKYDNFGRPTELYSGNDAEFSLNGKNYYDALGKLYKTGLGATIDPLDPHIDYIIYKQNIRDELIAQMSSNFRLGLQYNKNGVITDQYWSSEEFDPSDGAAVNVNRYHYYYDKSNRLIGADYRTQSFTENPFAYFDELAPLEWNEFDCTLNYEEAAPQVHQLAGVISNGGGNIAEAKKERAIAALYFVRDEYISSELDWNQSSTQEQDEFLSAAIEKSGTNNIDLKAYEEVLAIINNDQNHTAYLQQSPFVTNQSWSIQGQANIGETITYGAINAESMKYMKIALSTLVKWSLMNCKTNHDATIYGFLPDFDMSGTETNASKYDAAYWYKPNGNTSLLHRKDELGVINIQAYNYSNPLNNLLSDVDWDGDNKVYTYDALGNLTYDEQNNNTIAYSYFTDLPVSITTGLGVRSYRYNSDGIRSIKTVDGNTEYYLDGLVLANDESVKSYQTATGYATPLVDGSLSFHHNISDWLGTNRMVVNELGGVSSSRDHYPYGKQMPGRGFETDVEGKRFQFTGHEFDNEVNYGYHGARYYNRDLGRYMSIDPLAAKYPGLSPYVYTADNPIVFIDPSGKAVEDHYFSADGTYLGSVGEGNEVREVDASISNEVAIGIIQGAKNGSISKGDFQKISDKYTKAKEPLVDITKEQLIEMRDNGEGGYIYLDLHDPRGPTIKINSGEYDYPNGGLIGTELAFIRGGTNWDPVEGDYTGGHSDEDVQEAKNHYMRIYVIYGVGDDVKIDAYDSDITKTDKQVENVGLDAYENRKGPKPRWYNNYEGYKRHLREQQEKRKKEHHDMIKKKMGGY
jgi:RHS repeat-associated protein